MIEGSGSGSGRPKNMWIRWIRIRIRNTGFQHWQINFKDNKTKCRHLKKLTCRGSLRQCLLEFIVWRYGQSWRYFRPSFLNYCPSNLFCGSPPPSPPPFLCQSTVYTACENGGDHVLQEFNTLYLTRFGNYKIARPPQTITREVRGPQTDKHLPQNPFTGSIFFRWRHFALLSICLVFLWFSDSHYARKFRADTRGNVPTVSFGSEVLVLKGKYSIWRIQTHLFCLCW